MKLLVAEDHLNLLEAVQKTMFSEKYPSEIAADYPDAHEKVFLYAYDIMIVDIHLPGSSGLDLIGEIKTMNPETGIIVIS